MLRDLLLKENNLFQVDNTVLAFNDTVFKKDCMDIFFSYVSITNIKVSTFTKSDNIHYIISHDYPLSTILYLYNLYQDSFYRLDKMYYTEFYFTSLDDLYEEKDELYLVSPYSTHAFEPELFTDKISNDRPLDESKLKLNKGYPLVYINSCEYEKFKIIAGIRPGYNEFQIYQEIGMPPLDEAVVDAMKMVIATILQVTRSIGFVFEFGATRSLTDRNVVLLHVSPLLFSNPQINWTEQPMAGYTPFPQYTTMCSMLGLEDQHV